MKLSKIRAGSFMMGSSKFREYEVPVHRVRISKPFFIGKTEVTQAQFKEIMGMNPSYFQTHDSGERPVERVDWNEAVEFCNKLSLNQGLQQCYLIDKTKEDRSAFSGNDASQNSYNGCILWTVSCDFTKNGFRLPTEAEWEYACRAGTRTENYWGDSPSDDFAWHSTNHRTFGTMEVGLKRPNGFGLYDMIGNVREWCNDKFGPYSPEEQIDPKGPLTGDGHVTRGGGWADRFSHEKHDYYLESYCSSAARSSYRDIGREKRPSFPLLEALRLTSSDWCPGEKTREAHFGFRIVRNCQ
ncbi:MAG: formylglycine-generating enzyme family protein [Candidatus Ozemobacteraceae bacterium]